MEVANVQKRQILTFLELKKVVEEDRDLLEIKKVIRDMIDVGLALESIQAEDKVRIIIDPLQNFNLK